MDIYTKDSGLCQKLSRKKSVYKKYGHVRIFGYFDSGYAGDKLDRKSTTRYCTFIEENIVTWRSKKQNMISRSSAETEYRVMAYTACEMMWLKNLMMDLGFRQSVLMSIHCDNQSAIYLPKTLCFMRELSTLRFCVIWSEMLRLRR